MHELNSHCHHDESGQTYSKLINLMATIQTSMVNSGWESSHRRGVNGQFHPHQYRPWMIVCVDLKLHAIPYFDHQQQSYNSALQWAASLPSPHGIQWQLHHLDVFYSFKSGRIINFMEIQLVLDASSYDKSYITELVLGSTPLPQDFIEHMKMSSQEHWRQHHSSYKHLDGYSHLDIPQQ